MIPLISLKSISIERGGRFLLQDINWRLHSGDRVWLSGGNGAGKSTLLRLLSGDLWPDPGSGERLYHFDGEPSESPIGRRQQMAMVSAELHDTYLRNGWNLSVQDLMLAGLRHTIFPQGPATSEEQERCEEILEQFSLQEFSMRPLLQLSTGQIRRALIARSLIFRPVILLLDEICNGLDARSREEILKGLEMAVPETGVVVYTTHRAEDLPLFLNHEYHLEVGRLGYTGPIRGETQHQQQPQLAPRADKGSSATGNPLITITNAQVHRDEVRILHDINWCLREGDHWAIIGANGSGKSTFLALLHGDLVPALGGSILRFDLPEVSSVWDARTMMGYVSQELQALYHPRAPMEDVILSGCFASIGVYQQPTEDQRNSVERTIEFLRLNRLSGKAFGTLSYGEARKVLLGRAIVHNPRILLLDEPFNGLDRDSQHEFRELLDSIAGGGVSLVLSTHHAIDLPRCITSKGLMEGGRLRF